MIYADVIVDISHENLDRSYQYAVPPELAADIRPGTLVTIPFGNGNRELSGYVVGLSGQPKCPPEKIKIIREVVTGGICIESHLIALAYWIKDNYGASMNDALKTVIPIKKSVKNKEKKYIGLAKDRNEVEAYLRECEKKNNKARVRLLRFLLERGTTEQTTIVEQLGISGDTMKKLQEVGIIALSTEKIDRNPVKKRERSAQRFSLNREQRETAEAIKKDYRAGLRKTCLIHGITGSGKTEIYMDVIEDVVSIGRQVIMLIPEIALTFQTVMRFYERFGERVSILNSRMSAGERYDQSSRAKNGGVDIMIGPRSALFTPFEKLGLIILDEEHENSYKSESVPRYHARETAIERARLADALVILGSATPSVESYKKAQDGEYRLYKLNERAGAGEIPHVWVEDLREELKNKNKSIFSRRLHALIEDRLAKKEQTMLFINRRGYAGFISCRSCGHVMKCPHCEVSLTWHNNGKLMCHYCGHEENRPVCCPECASPYIAPFGTGTQKVEELVKKEFPSAGVLRMDADTTSGKGGHEKILSAFQNGEADILVGTQMIVKGHDIPNVTLVGIVAADLSLYANDYRASEKTFQLLTQAAGRAGRGKKTGEVVIQTYHPEHYAVVCAAAQDYFEFYRQEMLFRTLADYPPASHMLAILVTSLSEETVAEAADYLYGLLDKSRDYRIIGPAWASVSKLNDRYRRVIYIKYGDYEALKKIKDRMEAAAGGSEAVKGAVVQFDFDPVNNY